MISPQAAVMVLPHVPEPDEIAEYASHHLEDFPAENAYATVEITKTPPDWLDLHEQDQMAAHLRDGGDEMCILVIYMQEDLEGDDGDDSDDS